MAPALDAPPPCGGSDAHVALLASSGMGHLHPVLRLATALRSRECNVTLITAHPTVSLAESSHISAFLRSNPEVRHHKLNVLPLPTETIDFITDPFFRQFEAIRRSIHLLCPILQQASSSDPSLPPISALVVDIPLAFAMAKLLDDDVNKQLPATYILHISTAKFLALLSRLPLLQLSEPDDGGQVEIPGIVPIAKSSIPLPLYIPGHFFQVELLANGTSFPKFKGILLNTFQQYEPQTLEALNGGLVMQGLPPALPIGPLPAVANYIHHHTTTAAAADHDDEAATDEDVNDTILRWLDLQPRKSVVFVCFGSRSAVTKDQTAEIAKALDMSGYRFVWVVKGGIVDREDKEELADLLGRPFLDNVVGKLQRGLVIKEWVDQEKILTHPATGGFVCHCGLGSVMEAAERDVPLLAWPLNGDQKVCAEVVVEAGVGVWDRSWGWNNGKTLVAAVEIVGKLVELMEGGELKARAQMVGEEARRAVANGGSSDTVLKDFIRGARAKSFSSAFN